MEKMGVIEKMDEPSDWCAPCLVIPKKNSKIRVCIDFTRLNEAVKRVYHPLPATDETLAALGNSKVFTKLDANCGYWQLRLDEGSQKLTAFITPFGRFFCKRLPFGISSAPEIFQKEMQKALEGIEGVVCQMDDILIHSEEVKDHEAKVRQVLKRLLENGITLNPEKCEFKKDRVTFLGHVIDQDGVHADPEKLTAINSFPAPKNQKEMKRFFGMVNYLGKFTASLADDTVRLRQLLKKDVEWTWDSEMQQEFEAVKKKMASAPVLAPYSLEADTWLSTDASSYGLGAALFQKCRGEWKPVAFASRSMNETEQRYAQIEKEALAICWAAEKFYYYLAGRDFTIETDHKPLVSLLGEKELSKLPLRIQRFRLRMMRFKYHIGYTPGEKLVVADALSRSPVEKKPNETHESSWVLEMVEELPISARRKQQLLGALEQDAVSSLLITFVHTRWPTSQNCPTMVKKFFTFKEELTVIDGLLFYRNRMYIPLSERDRVLTDIHKGHQGESKCLRRAADVVWWPGMSTDIREMVKKCEICTKYRQMTPEPLMSSPFPEKPWWKLGMDLCSLEDGKQYLVITDYYSRYIIAEKMEETTSEAICTVVEKIFCRLGVPHVVISDNGPQFIAEQFQSLMKRWDILHRTSAPRYPQSNGVAERAVQTFKNIAKRNANIETALLCYRDSPLENGFSPAQLLMGRGLNSMGYLRTSAVNLQSLKSYEQKYRGRQAHTYNSRHRTKVREPLLVGSQVWLSEPGRTPCQTTVIAAKGRELALRKDSGVVLRRNRRYVTADNTERIPEDVPTSPNQRNRQDVSTSAVVVCSKPTERNDHITMEERDASASAQSGQENVVPTTIAPKKEGGKQPKIQTAPVRTRTRVIKAPVKLDL